MSKSLPAPISALAALALAVYLLAPQPAVATTAEPAQELLGLYAQMHATLAADRVEGVRETAQRLAARADALGDTAADPAPFERVATAARAVRAEQLGFLREQFRGLSRAMAGLVEATGATGAQLYYCSMAKGYWLQPTAERAVRNPYYGSSMLDCGERVERVAG